MIRLEIRCNTCGAVGLADRGHVAHRLRHKLKARGWKCLEVGGKDFCPKCQPKRTRVRR